MKIILINIIILSFIMGTRVIDSSNIPTLGDNRSCGQRPILDNNIISPSGSFMIHYDNYYDEIDDYAYSVAIAADSSRKVIVEIMNFRSEVQDDDGLYDIYIKQLPNGSYGWNCPDGDLGKSWVEIDDDYIGTGYSTSGLDAMKISVAHEYFHAIQRSYKPMPGQNSFFYELSSIWIEDIVYPEINDYIFFSQYGDDYFSDPEKNMNEYNGYGLGLYGHYMNFEFDNQIMQRIWEDFSLMDSDDETEYVFNAIDNVLNNQDFGYNSSFVQTWLDFNSKNIFNGYFSDMQNHIYYYSDQVAFNPIETNSSLIDTIESISFGLNNRSVSIRSYIPKDISIINIYNNPNYEDISGSLALISNSSAIYNIYHNYQSDLLNSNDNFHILYIADSNNREFESSIVSTILDNSDEIFIYPNPIYLDNNISFRFNSGIRANQIILKLFNIHGQLLKIMNLGSIDYTLNDFHNFNIPFFDDHFSSGIYIISFDLDGKIINKKITYLK
tara:strand:- start:675 stop:2168 length:1494 start_codon:yes stop_codon:yes gene_type:complete